MHKRFDHWKDVCKLHWKEIVTLSIALHWIVDLFIMLPIVGTFFYWLGGGFG